MSQIVTVKGVIISHRLLSSVFNRTMYFLRCLGFAWTHPICAIFSMNNLNLFGCLHTSESVNECVLLLITSGSNNI